jgi:hypothetical protein
LAAEDDAGEAQEPQQGGGDGGQASSGAGS